MGYAYYPNNNELGGFWEWIGKAKEFLTPAPTTPIGIWQPPVTVPPYPPEPEPLPEPFDYGKLILPVGAGLVVLILGIALIKR